MSVCTFSPAPYPARTSSLARSSQRHTVSTVVHIFTILWPFSLSASSNISLHKRCRWGNNPLPVWISGNHESIGRTAELWTFCTVSELLKPFSAVQSYVSYPSAVRTIWRKECDACVFLLAGDELLRTYSCTYLHTDEVAAKRGGDSVGSANHRAC